jgi:hypothetical protein
MNYPTFTIFFPGEAVELCISKLIEKSVPTKINFIDDSGVLSQRDSCRDWKSMEMIDCIQNHLMQQIPEFGCRLPMTVNRGKV